MKERQSLFSIPQRESLIAYYKEKKMSFLYNYFCITFGLDSLCNKIPKVRNSCVLGRISFHIKNGVALYGGFAGSVQEITTISQGPAQPYVTGMQPSHQRRLISFKESIRVTLLQSPSQSTRSSLTC